MNQEKMPPSDVRTKFDVSRNSSFLPMGFAGGFSGAMFWQVETIEATYCLRRYPIDSPTVEQLAWIHQILLHATANGCPQVESILKTIDGDTFVQSEGHLWQLSEWMPGEANFSESPNEAKLLNAVDFLARFHLASAQINLDFRTSDAIAQRLGMLGRFETTLAAAQKAVTAPTAPTELVSPSIRELLDWMSTHGKSKASDMAKSLAEFETTIFPIQPVIRDIWHDHVFYTGDTVSGVVDFGSMAMDTVCLDLARLLGSYVGDEVSKWELAIDNYAQLRALTKPERLIIQLLDQTGVLLGGMNWLTWLLVDSRTFDDSEAVERRVQYLLSRLG